MGLLKPNSGETGSDHENDANSIAGIIMRDYGKQNPDIYKVGVLSEAKKETLHTWFKRRGAKGKEKGWVDCNAPDGKGGYKTCGRKEGEKRAKYPSCRPTPSACKRPGKGKTWGKTK